MTMNVTIGRKIIAISLAIGLLAIIVTGTASYLTARNSLEKEAFNKLIAVRDIKKSQIEEYVQRIQDDVVSLSESTMTIEAMKAFKQAFHQLGADVTRHLKDAYIHDNPHPTGQKENLDYAADGSEYSQLHKKYHPIVRSYLRKYGYYDIFLVDPQTGHIVYTVFKELDYATSLTTGTYRDSGIADCFRAVNSLRDPAETRLVDFAPYAPSHGAAASFIGSPIYDGAEKIGVLMFQMPVDKINAIMQERSGLGDSGETYLVGEDKLMRSNSRFEKESTIIKKEVDTRGVLDALSGTVSMEIFLDYRGIPVLSAYAPLQLKGLKWVIMSEIDEAEAYAPVNALRNRVLLWGGLVLVAVVFGALLLAQNMVRPIKRISTMIQDIAQGEGDLTKRLQVDTKDEIAELADWFNQFIEKLHDIISQVNVTTEQVASAATELSSTAEQISTGAEQTSAQADTVASATEELSATAQQIAQNCTDAVEAADVATGSTTDGQGVVEQTVDGMNQIAARVDESAQTIQSLSASAEKIGDVISVIDDIADQTNLLALNAAIEAARAGEQGRGFAVVADEVRKLAESTAQSTQEITVMIKTIQDETKEAVVSMEQGVAEVEAGTKFASQAGDALETIAGQIVAVTDMVRQVATAAEQQTATTGEISQNIQQVADVTQQSASGAQQSVQSAIELSELSNQLRRLVGQFKLRENGRADPAAFIQPQNALTAIPEAHLGNETR